MPLILAHAMGYAHCPVPDPQFTENSGRAGDCLESDLRGHAQATGKAA